MLTPEVALSVRKTPPGSEPFDLEAVEAVSDARGAPSTGRSPWNLVDTVAER